MDLKDNNAGKSGTTATGDSGKKPDTLAGNSGKQSADTLADNSGKRPDTLAGNGGNLSDTPADEMARQIADLKAKLAKVESDKEIYRAGLLAAKQLGKKAKKITLEDLSDPDKLESVIDAKIQDRELEQKALEEAARKASEEERLRLENEELRRSLEATKMASLHGGVGSGTGVNENSISKPNTYWTEEQRNELRRIYASRNMYSPEQIEKMVKKAEEIAITRTATSPRDNDIVEKRRY